MNKQKQLSKKISTLEVHLKDCEGLSKMIRREIEEAKKELKELKENDNKK